MIWKVTLKLLLLLIIVLVLLGNAELLNGKSGNEYLSKSNITVLRGKMTLVASSDGGVYKETSEDIAYPTGYNKDNCIVISIGLKTSGLNTYSFERGIDDAMDAYFGTIPRRIILDSNIQLRGYNNQTNDMSLDYKIVLMKYEVSDSEYTLGDVNQDGSITEEDSNLALYFSTGSIALTEQQIKAADINKDGIVLAEDALKIRKYATGEIDSLE